jgi:hypothetical protein
MSDLFRKEYIPLTDEQKAKNDAIKDKAQELLDLIEGVVPPTEKSERSRYVALARTNLETSIMFAVKAVTAKTV